MSGSSIYEQLVSLHSECKGLSPEQIISRLEIIRTQNGFLPLHPDDLITYEIFITLATSDKLSETDARKMARMLFWNEYEMQQVHGLILLALERFPQREFRELLSQFIKNAKEELTESYAGTHRYADLSSRKSWAEKILAKC